MATLHAESREDYLAAQAAIFDRLDRHMPTVQMLSHRQSQKIDRVLAFSLPCLFLPLAALLLSGAREVHEVALSVPLVAASTLGMVGSIFTLLAAVSEQCKRPINDFVKERLFLRQDGLPLTPEQALEIADLAKSYPRIHEACVRWAQTTGQAQLTSREYRATENTRKALEKLDRNGPSRRFRS